MCMSVLLQSGGTVFVQPGLENHGGGGGVYFMFAGPPHFERILGHSGGITFIDEFYRQTSTALQLSPEPLSARSDVSRTAFGVDRAADD